MHRKSIINFIFKFVIFKEKHRKCCLSDRINLLHKYFNVEYRERINEYGCRIATYEFVVIKHVHAHTYLHI